MTNLRRIARRNRRIHLKHLFYAFDRTGQCDRRRFGTIELSVAHVLLSA